VKRLFPILTALLAGCASLHRTTKDVDVTRNIVFSKPDGRPLALDLYVPRTEKPAPLIVWIHGGGWKIGSKGFRLLIKDLTRHGFAIASMDYRLSTRAKWPAQHLDCVEAIEWLRKHGAEYHIDPSRMALSGDSAGGHLAALIGLEHGEPRIRAVLALYPPTDLVALGEVFRDNPRNLIVQLFGDSFENTKTVAAEASPVNHVAANAPPFLFIHGDKDDTVPLDQSFALDKLLRENGTESRILVMKGRGHAFSLNRQNLEEAQAFFTRALLGASTD